LKKHPKATISHQKIAALATNVKKMEKTRATNSI